MITAYDKFVVALVGVILFAANNFFGFSVALPEPVFTAIVTIGTPLLVWLVPNKAEPE